MPFQPEVKVSFTSSGIDAAAARSYAESHVRHHVPDRRPVGFVGAAESKEALARDGRVPFVVVHGRRGGSAMTAAAINALAQEIE